MASNIIDYYFAPISGYAYLGHSQLHEIASQTGATIRYHPLDMVQVFAAAGSFPPAKYPHVRQKHRKADMARWAAERDLPLNESPAFWPAAMGQACTVIMAAEAAGADTGAVAFAMMSAVWTHELNISDPDDIAKALDLHDLPREALLDAARTPESQDKATWETNDAIKKGIFGSPTYVVGEDWFFGQDRLDFLARAL